ncbi:MAG: CHC2 zinc finger domain-containing protein [Bryobacteraceae bacterium]
MARIPDEDIERLKQEVPLQRLVEAQGIELKRHGADLLGLCPFHEDHAPSGSQSEKELVALPRRLSDRRLGKSIG